MTATDLRRELHTKLHVAMQDARDDYKMFEGDLLALQEVGAEIGKLAKATAARLNGLTDGRMAQIWTPGVGDAHTPMTFDAYDLAACMVESGGLDCLDGFYVIRAAAVMEASQ